MSATRRSNGSRSRWLVFPLVRVVVLASLILLGCGSDPLGPERNDLVSARSRWAAVGVQSYVFEFWQHCMVCGASSVVIEVVNGLVSSVSPPDPGDLFAGPVTEPPTIEDLFETIQRVIDQGADSFDAEYDPVLGYPSRVSIDYEERAIDDEVSLGVSSLQALDPALQ